MDPRRRLALRSWIRALFSGRGRILKLGPPANYCDLQSLGQVYETASLEMTRKSNKIQKLVSSDASNCQTVSSSPPHEPAAASNSH